jgi:hypothetical protein
MSENIIDFVCDYIKGSGKKTAFISGGKRQFLFIKKKLAVMKDRSFTSPSFFTNDDFIENAIFENTKLVKIPDIEAAFIIYEIIRLEASELLKGKKSFSEFLQWAIEIVSFINQLDLENVSQDMLKNVKANADIGYDVPESINNLLKNIFRIRTLFHASLEKASKTAKGLSFLKVSEFDSEKIIGDFEEIILAAPFYLHKTEIQIYKKIFDSEKLTIIVQGNPLEYSSLRKIYDAFGVPLPPYAEKNRDMSLNIYCAYDDQSQSTLLKNLISRLPEKEHDKTAVILPETKLLQSVVSEISVITDNYNVSAGYPAAKTAVFTLLKSIIDAQISRRGKNYYVKDLIKVFSNPLVKNMRFFGDASLSRIIAHKLEQSFDKNSKNHLAGKVFVSFDEIVSAKNVLKEISKSSAGASGYINPEKLKGILTDIFNTLFTVWEKPQTLADFAAEMQLFTEKLCNLSIVSSYPLNSPAIEIILSLCAQMKYGRVSQVKFAQSDILNIFGDLIKNERISLLGSPLKGLQILGLLESRNLSFENIFIIGMTDSAIPAVKKDSPLIPKDIMFALGIEMAKKDYEIQNYHFNRLTSAAKNINLIYPDNEKEERSRFIERLIWDKQLKNKDLDTVKTKGFIIPVFIGINKEKKKYEKTDKIKQYLKKIKYSYSKIDTYLRCRLEFYFKYVLGLDKAAEIGEEAAESEMGSFVHKFLQTVFYEGMESSKLKEKDFEKHFHEELDRLFENSFELKFREDAFLIKKVLDYRMAELLNFESAREYDGICFCEKKYETVLQSANNTYDIECVIDRIDKKGTDYVILDYKTGKTDAPLISSNFNKLVADGLTRKNIKKAVKSLQLPLYKYVFERCEKAKAAECGIYDIKKSEIFNFFSNAKNAEETYNSCIKIIETILDEISAGEYFEFDKDDGVNCERCKFFYICRTQ